MDNQHKLIKGYRDLTHDEIELMNEAKELAVQVGDFVRKLKMTHGLTGGHCLDLRWVEIGETDLQKGFMAVIRSIARPETF